eukprot:CAMPEP_0195094188 /NCGR_PEP_ID=MMETSP0448-20130528/43008_1 /TAXON_ID=66468 /ORGANISM="Heterocapsa triquestra, Strain CCMP 448" /LENGTH=71 /DNA_ID=CAMNT_0040128211 /DNA_START=79 /DNA_END=291 /DNA_ORIENTATION=+
MHRWTLYTILGALVAATLSAASQDKVCSVWDHASMPEESDVASALQHKSLQVVVESHEEPAEDEELATTVT